MNVKPALISNIRNLIVFRIIATSRELGLLEKEKRLGRIERI
jgi:hypothetical protein